MQENISLPTKAVLVDIWILHTIYEHSAGCHFFFLQSHFLRTGLKKMLVIKKNAQNLEKEKIAFSYAVLSSYWWISAYFHSTKNFSVANITNSIFSPILPLGTMLPWVKNSMIISNFAVMYIILTIIFMLLMNYILLFLRLFAWVNHGLNIFNAFLRFMSSCFLVFKLKLAMLPADLI